MDKNGPKIKKKKLGENRKNQSKQDLKWDSNQAELVFDRNGCFGTCFGTCFGFGSVSVRFRLGK